MPWLLRTRRRAGAARRGDRSFDPGDDRRQARDFIEAGDVRRRVCDGRGHFGAKREATHDIGDEFLHGFAGCCRCRPRRDNRQDGDERGGVALSDSSQDELAQVDIVREFSDFPRHVGAVD